MPSTIREVVGVFRDDAALDSAVTELQSSGFARTDLSVLTPPAAPAAADWTVRDVEDSQTARRTVFVSKASLGDAEGVLVGLFAYVGAIIAAGTAVASDLDAAGVLWAVVFAGAGAGAVGCLLAMWLGRRYAHRMVEQLRHGGLVLWVRVDDTLHEGRARDILARYNAADIHVHEIEAAPHFADGGMSYRLSFMNRLGM
jgi:hypothetical protein